MALTPVETSANCTFALYATQARAYVVCQPGGTLPYIFYENLGTPTFAAQAVGGGATPNGRSVAVTPWDNRAVIGPVGAAASASRLLFSDPGDLGTWPTNNFIDLISESEPITAILTWRDMLFVFKANRYYVFYGTSVDSAGGPIFNYRTVATGVGAAGYRAACAAPDGVYFMHSTGVYRTVGDLPVKVSGALDPLFTAAATPLFQGNKVSPIQFANAHLCHSNGRVACAYTATGASTNQQMVVFDTIEQAWTYWNVPASAMASWSDATVGDTLMFGTPAATFRIGKFDSSTSDNGTAIASRYRTAFWNPGQAGGESVIREWLFDGYGTVDVKTAANDSSTLGAAASVALGTSPAIAQGRDRRACRGRNFSLEISASSGAWSLSRAIANVRGQRNAGLKAT
jgi:hypothetical protein